MATYSISGHTLEFINDYEKLRVKTSGGATVEDWDLTGDTPVKVAVNVALTSWEITTESPTTTPKTHKHDTLNSAVLTFSAPSGNARLGGMGLIDLRDLGITGNYSVTYYVDSCPVYLSYHGGNRATHVAFIGSGCYEYASIEE